LGEEYDYCEEERKAMKQVLENRNIEADRRYERASKVAQRIFQNQELKMKQKEDQRNEEFTN